MIEVTLIKKTDNINLSQTFEVILTKHEKNRVTNTNEFHCENTYGQ